MYNSLPVVMINVESTRPCIDTKERITKKLSSGVGVSVCSKNIPFKRYQRDHIKRYLNLSNELLPPESYFNRARRAYPDIRLVGHQYRINVFGNSDITTGCLL